MPVPFGVGIVIVPPNDTAVPLIVTLVAVPTLLKPAPTLPPVTVPFTVTDVIVLLVTPTPDV